MRRGGVLTVVIMLAISLMIIPAAVAHAPLGKGDASTLEDAAYIPDPAKSWAIYSSLDSGGDAEYYIFDIGEGERIYLSLITAAGSKESGFVPNVILMGPGITNQSVPPAWIEIEEESGIGVIVINGTQPENATYEPFSPSGFYEVAELDIEAPASGDYHIVVFSESIGGNYGLAVGYVESFNIDEWMFLPFVLISIYEWTGQNIFYVLAPILFVLVLGTFGLYWRAIKGKPPKTLVQWMIGIAGLLILSWGASVLFQIANALTYAPLGSEVIISLMFAIVPILIGVYMFTLAQKEQVKIRVPTRVLLIVLGPIAIFMLAGFLIGPILAIVAGIIPFFVKNKETKEEAQKSG
ncbi:MAG: hypothetical protein OEV21_03100 [Thermoplasmata archaeon]|nr:hypothetical protein [Thermoplasmata archaeon]